MKDKTIQDILDKLNEGYDDLEVWEFSYLDNYITNLQQKNEDNMKCIKSIKEQLESVINENQRLLNKWFENNDKMVELIGEKEVYNESLKEYKSRIEKAVEYIKEAHEQDFMWLPIFEKELLNILNGRSDE